MGGFGFGSRVQTRMRGGGPPPPPPPLVRYGRDAGHDAGTDGTMFLDPLGGSDANNGLTAAAPKLTFAAAWTAFKAQTGDRTLRIIGNGAKVRGTSSADPLAFPYANAGTLKIAGYGTDVPVFTGAVVVTGWTPCNASDDPRLGASVRPNCYKATIAKSAIAHGEWQALLMTEADEPLDLAQKRRDMTSDTWFFLDNYHAMFASGKGDPVSFTTDASGYITAATLTGVVGAYPPAQIMQARLAVHSYPNLANFLTPVSVAGDTITVAANTVKPETVGGSKFSLVNLLPEMHAGGWGWHDDGSANLTLYCWPRDPASLASGIEIASATRVLSVRGDAARKMMLENLRITMASGALPDDGLGLYINTAQNVTVRHCILENFSHKERGYGAFQAKFSSNVRFERVTIRNCQMSYGGFWNGSGPSNLGFDNRCLNLRVENVSLGFQRVYGQQRFAMIDVQPVNCCLGPHANPVNFYFQCDMVVLLGLMPDPVTGVFDGYFTNSQSSRLLIAHTVMRLGRDGRAYYDQSALTPVVQPAQHWMINCWVPHEAGRIGSYMGLSVGNTAQQVNWLVANCVTPGITTIGGMTLRRNNVLTRGTAADASEVVETDLARLHRDAANGDWLPKPGGLLASKAGFDVTEVIAQFEQWMPDLDLRRDIRGAPWDPAAPGVGIWQSA